MDKFSVKTHLIVNAVPTKKEQSNFLLIEEDNKLVFPNEYLTKNTITKDIATRLLNDYTGVTLDWAILFPFGLIDDVDPDKDEIHILYGVFIPEPTRIRKPNSVWKTYNDLYTLDEVPELTKKLAHEAIWRQV